MHDLQQQLVANEMESKIRYEKIINDMKDQFRYVSDSNEKKVDVVERQGDHSVALGLGRGADHVKNEGCRNARRRAQGKDPRGARNLQPEDK